MARVSVLSRPVFTVLRFRLKKKPAGYGKTEKCYTVYKKSIIKSALPSSGIRQAELKKQRLARECLRAATPGTPAGHVVYRLPDEDAGLVKGFDNYTKVVKSESKRFARTVIPVKKRIEHGYE